MALQSPESLPVVLECFSRLTFAKKKNCEYTRSFMYGTKSIMISCPISHEGRTLQPFSKFLR